MAYKRSLIDSEYDQLSISRQCELLDIHRSGYYYKPVGESEDNLALMRLIDEAHTKYPFYGSPRMTHHLANQMGKPLNVKRVARLMRKMNIRSVLPRPNTSQPAEGHKIYPYLLRGLEIEKPNQVWSTDITYIPMARGFLYLTAVMDWFSRFVLAWELSNNLERWFCIRAVEEALQWGSPQIFNTDQGAQFTSNDFTGLLVEHKIRISMDGKGRAIDNIFTERLWWSVKYEKVYLHEYEDGKHLWDHLKEYFDYYNYVRPHQSLGNQTPAQVFGIEKNPARMR